MKIKRHGSAQVLGNRELMECPVAGNAARCADTLKRADRRLTEAIHLSEKSALLRSAGLRRGRPARFWKNGDCGKCQLPECRQPQPGAAWGYRPKTLTAGGERCTLRNIPHNWYKHCDLSFLALCCWGTRERVAAAPKARSCISGGDQHGGAGTRGRANGAKQKLRRPQGAGIQSEAVPNTSGRERSICMCGSNDDFRPRWKSTQAERHALSRERACRFRPRGYQAERDTRTSSAGEGPCSDTRTTCRHVRSDSRPMRPRSIASRLALTSALITSRVGSRISTVDGQLRSVPRRQQRHENSRTSSRSQTPATALRLLLLKHVRNWSYDTLEREVRANLAYRNFLTCS
jgi:hypothetical protein